MEQQIIQTTKKELALKLIKQGQTIEATAKELDIPVKIIYAYLQENEEFKTERLGQLQAVLEYDTRGGYLNFTWWERIHINQERGKLMRDEPFTEPYVYPEKLRNKIYFIIGKLYGISKV